MHTLNNRFQFCSRYVLYWFCICSEENALRPFQLSLLTGTNVLMLRHMAKPKLLARTHCLDSLKEDATVRPFAHLLA